MREEKREQRREKKGGEVNATSIPRTVAQLEGRYRDSKLIRREMKMLQTDKMVCYSSEKKIRKN